MRFVPEPRLLERYRALVDREKLWTSSRILLTYLEYLFRGASPAGKSVLDIGAGSGLFSLYALCAGARRVVGLEPEAAGSSAGMQARFEEGLKAMGLSNGIMLPSTFQDYDPGEDRFELVVLHNSINHLDEDACVRLHHDDQARATYRRLLSKLHDVTNSGAILIIADCTRHNFFDLLGLRNPFHPTIEWYKHQSPRLWSSLLKESGFEVRKIRWTSFSRLGRAGRALFGNKYAAFFLTSHFCMTAVRM